MIGRIPVLDIRPVVDCGRRPARAVVGETLLVTATVFREGQDAVNANVVLRDPRGRGGPWTPMRELAPGSDRWGAEITPTCEGRWTYTVEAWGDPLATWMDHAAIKIPAGLDVPLVLAEGAELLERAARRVPKKDGRAVVLEAVDALRDESRAALDRFAAAQAAEVTQVLCRHPLRELVTASRAHTLQVERRRALFGSWYELFPRSEGAVVQGPGGQRLTAPRSGTFRTAAERLPAIAAMGFDVVYLPPVHPIGGSFRKGPNNSLDAGPGAVGSPWAIGSPEGGHDAVHPDLGTIEDFDFFVERARELRMEVALDFALQCSPDHPWVAKHPEWFAHRIDGSIAYAENPPKKYQDIYPLSFDQDMPGLIRECVRVLRFWMGHGVRIFRVDNPHTKPVVFWEKVIADIGKTDPDVIFLAEAFTRPAMMHTLAKIGFQQSYTYFTWRNTKEELQDYLTELSGDAAAYMRPNFFVNTPDILHAYLQGGGRPAFAARAVLAATLSPSWGMYAGFELCEATPVSEGSEEYLDSEKYQLRPRDWAAAEARGQTISPLITKLNRLRRRHPALQELRNLRFHHTDNEAILAFSKRKRLTDDAAQGGPNGTASAGRGVFDPAAGPGQTHRVGPANGDRRGQPAVSGPFAAHGADTGRCGSEPSAGYDTVLVIVNLDPHHTHEATVSLSMPDLGLDWARSFAVRDELTGESYHWGRDNYVRLEPARAPAHIFSLRPSPLIGGSPN